MPQIYAGVLRSSLIAGIIAMLVPVADTALGQTFIACEPYGGKGDVKAFLENELRFPPEDLARDVKGESVLIFTVTREGKVTDLRVWRSLTPECDREALRLAALVRWHPGLMSGVPVDAEHYLKVPFNARRYHKQHAAGVRCPAEADRPPADPDPGIHSYADLDTNAAPIIPGGLAGIDRYFAENMTYPPDAAKRDIQGVVELEFVVERSGNVSNLWAVRDLGGGCGEEAKKVIRSICWTPAVKNGLRVRSVLRVTLTFKLVTRTH